MPTYAWKGRNASGSVQEGVLTSANKEALVATLRKQQILVTAVTEKGKEFALPKFGGGISQKDIAIFTRQFSVMIDAGLPLVQCLEILAGQQSNRVFKKVLIQVRQDVEAGASLADAMRKHPAAFSDLFCNMVAAGETGGILVELQAGRMQRTGQPFLEVLDQGHGVDPSTVDKIFEPFYTDRSGGTGLGLYISRELCELNRATLVYQDREQGGSIFRMVFADPDRWEAVDNE